jgi:hypothetical protein
MNLVVVLDNAFDIARDKGKEQGRVFWVREGERRANAFFFQKQYNFIYAIFI